MSYKVTIEKESIELKSNKFPTFTDFIEEVEDYKLGKIMEKNSDISYDINILEKRYLG